MDICCATSALVLHVEIKQIEIRGIIGDDLIKLESFSAKGTKICANLFI